MPIGLALFLAAATAFIYSRFRKRHAAPGPPRVPILGNVLQHPRKLQFLQYTEWAKKYGELVKQNSQSRLSFAQGLSFRWTSLASTLLWSIPTRLPQIYLVRLIHDRTCAWPNLDAPNPRPPIKYIQRSPSDDYGERDLGRWYILTSCQIWRRVRVCPMSHINSSSMSS